MIQEAIKYFDGDKGFHRLFSLFKKKYESLERVGGSVNINNFNDDELSSIARFFGQSILDLRRSGKISLKQFEDQLQRTKFEGINLLQLLEAYFNEKLLSKKQVKQLKEKENKTVIQKLEKELPSLSFWFNYLYEKTPDTHWIYRKIEENPDTFSRDMNTIGMAFKQLPIEFERLPVFSQKITRNPHAFDLNTNLGKLFIHVLSVHHANGRKISIPSESESINDLLLHYKIMRDDITNYVTSVNLVAETKQGIHPMWAAAATSNSVMNIPLRELISLFRIYPKIGNKVWIVENSGVFSSILDEIPNVPLICTHGQFKLAALLLMNFLVKDGYQLYYAGDIDPEGIRIATRLLERYPSHVKLWKMTVKDYEKSLSEETISNERLKKLDSINSKELLEVIDSVKNVKKAGYQEALIFEMVEELKSMYE
ncbi:TIGR02679 family protein [Bacillaceae bacterium W0354]